VIAFPSRVDPRQQYRPTLAPVPEVLPELFFFPLTLKLCNMESTSLALIGLLAMIVVITVIALATS
jgi:hypothetical protein